MRRSGCSRSKAQQRPYTKEDAPSLPPLSTGGNQRNTRARAAFGTSADNGPVTYETRQSPGHHRLWEEGSIFLEEQITERRKALSILRAVRIEEAAVRQSLFVQYGSAPRGAKALSTVENQEYDVHESSRLCLVPDRALSLWGLPASGRSSGHCSEDVPVPH